MDRALLMLLARAGERLQNSFAHLPAATPSPVDPGALEKVLMQVADRLQNNYPYFHPLYAGQMMKPPHPIARLAYALAMEINPNNHALDGGYATSAMEQEAVKNIARIFGWRTCLGHLCSGGTMANLEGLWVAGQLNPHATVVASSQAHYTHQRISSVLGLPFESIPSDRHGRMDLESLEHRLKQGGVGTVVATIGTTATGAVDPLPPLLRLRKEYRFRLHADAAYGGYFVLANTVARPAREALDCLGKADSIVVDPHKHGLQPYGCGCILFRDPGVGRFYQHESPYTYFTSAALHLGEISLECSRPGAAAAALWATQKLLPLVKRGGFARGLDAGRAAARELYRKLKADPRFITASPPELDIVVWTLKARSITSMSALSCRLQAATAKHNLHLALADLPIHLLNLPAGVKRDADVVTCLRSVLMKPEHRTWLDRIWAIIDDAPRQITSRS